MDSVPQTLWNSRIPLHISHPSLPNTPLVTSLPRFSYLALLAPRCSAFFRSPVSAFHHEDLLLRNLPLGLLVDLYQPPLPWRLTVSDGDSWDIGDTFLNCVKEADFVRYGNAKRIMSLSKADTSTLWNAVQDNDYASFSKINALLLNAPTPLRHIPLRIYIPSSSPSLSSQQPLNTLTSSTLPSTTSPSASSLQAPVAPAATTPPNPQTSPSPAPPQQHQQQETTGSNGAFKVLQALISPSGSSNTAASSRGPPAPKTVGQALRSLHPSLFPSSRDPILANALLHGSPVPFSAPLEDLMREAAYPDGWLCLAVVLL